eukprot:Phypoly_transcript_04661.p1 GENE.Phypoly_transcript_04661~~Phypoly_transcript_04661.p1  ORF type:complete len:687 (+),score=101.99 Phypoly_transcript_04661:296-2062(+)
MAEWLGKAVSLCNNTEHKDALLKLLIAWCTKFYFSVSSVKPFIDKLGPSAKQKSQLALLPNTSLAPLKRKAPPQEKPTPQKTYRPSSPPPATLLDAPGSPTPAPSSTPPKPSFGVQHALVPPEQSILDTLPAEVLKIIFSYLSPYPQIVNLSLVSRTIRDAASFKYLWRSLVFTEFMKLPAAALGSVVASTLKTSCFHVQSLDFSYCKTLTDAILQKVAVNCPELVKLNLTGCGVITVRALSAISKQCPNLQKLSLFAVKCTTKKCINHILANCHSLRSLNLRCCHETYDWLDSITAAPTTLQKLDISCHCLRGNIEFEKVSKLLSNIPSLTILRAAGVIRGIPADWGVKLGSQGELQGFHLPREGVSVRTMDLWLASAIGNAITVQKLLAEPSPKLEMRSNRGTTPLMIAAEAGHMIIVEMLLAAGARVQHRDVDGNSAIGVAQSIAIVKCLFAHGAVAETKQERDIRNILAVIEKYPPLPDWKPAVRARKRPLLTFPPHSDTEKILEFVKDKRTNAFDCAEDALRTLAWFLSNKEYLYSFVTRDMPSYRRDLAAATIGRDEFFKVLMPYLTMEEQKMILMHIGAIL